MLNKIIRYSLNNRLLILVASVLLLFAGLYTSMKMDVDVFPDLNAPTVVVMTEAPGMAPEEVERLVTFPVETALNGATDVRRVRSSSTTGFSVVWVEFDWGTDIYRARQITSEKLAVVGESLPEGVGTPTLGPQSSILGEMMIIGLTSDSTSLRDLRTLADWTIRPRLLSIGGVAQVTVIGGEMKEYQILLDLPRMKQYGVTLDEVLNAAREMNRNANGGILYEYGNEYIVRGAVATTDVDAIAKAVVKRVDGVPVLMGDVAEVKIGHAGTLDPLATGVLVLCTGKCTKQIEQLQTHTKEYTATLQLGATTASYDKEHSVNHTYPTKHITRQLVEETLKQFVGEIQQVPPTYSAVKVNGDRSYALRRAGEEVQLKPKTVRVDEIELTDYNDEEKTASIRVVCGKGTYIRSLARDIGRALDSGAYLTALRRTKAGSFAVENCISFDHFQEWLDEQPLEDSLQPSK